MTDSPAAAPRPGPRAETLLDDEFWQHCTQERLCFQVCDDCETWRHLPRMMCAQCGSAKWAWQQSAGRGHLYSWTVTHQAMLPQFASEVPYVVAVVEFDEGVRMVSQLRGVETDELEIGIPLELYFERFEDGFALPMFRPGTSNPQ
ncbi:MAG: Zn-ribbon domain-containing OB-fold protein [bacterium]|nr:Zn-ribbon domain-containing OB-fold protein [bacterium]